LPASLLPEQIWEKKPKIIHVSRNPKDVAVSFYHWMKLMFPVVSLSISYHHFSIFYF
jgi:hypothetical protein